MNFVIVLRGSLLFDTFYLPLNYLKTKKAMNAKVSMLVIYVKTIICLLLYDLEDCTFKSRSHHLFTPKQT